MEGKESEQGEGLGGVGRQGGIGRAVCGSLLLHIDNARSVPDRGRFWETHTNTHADLVLYGLRLPAFGV